MGLEQQLHFDISRCSLCPLGAQRIYCAPKLSKHADTVILLDSPSMGACDAENPWRHPAATFLTKAFAHACGGDLSRFHLTFLSKCHTKLDGMTPPQRQRRDWAQVCASQYLDLELKSLGVSRILIFGELSVRACFPNLEQPWSELSEGHERLAPYDIPAYFFDAPSRFQRAGLSSEEGLAWLQRLHGVLGGQFSPPDLEQESSLFDLL